MEDTEILLRNAMEHHGAAVYRLALCRMQSVQDAEDVYQDVFLRLLDQDITHWDGEHLRAWLLRCTVNRCNDLPRGHLDLHRDLSPYQYIVYDTSLFCYVDIFRIFAEDKAGKRQMGFYSPQTEVLTTNAMALA